jgi:hypothetical protein
MRLARDAAGMAFSPQPVIDVLRNPNIREGTLSEARMRAFC